MRITVVGAGIGGLTVNASWRLNQLINLRSRWARRTRDAAMSLVPESLAAKQFHRILHVPDFA